MRRRTKAEECVLAPVFQMWKNLEEKGFDYQYLLGEEVSPTELEELKAAGWEVSVDVPENMYICKRKGK